MPEQPRDPHHYEMKIPSEPDQATLKRDQSRKPPAEDVNREAANTAKDTNAVRGDEEPQAVRRGE